MAKTKKPSGGSRGKAKKRPMRKAKKQYSIAERYKYHRKRDSNWGDFGFQTYGDPKITYSTGFVDAFNGVRSNDSTITHYYGKRSGTAYLRGYERGRKAKHEYFITTGKQPGDLDREIR